jgi:hypothetical protein
VRGIGPAQGDGADRAETVRWGVVRVHAGGTRREDVEGIVYSSAEKEKEKGKEGTWDLGDSNHTYGSGLLSGMEVIYYCRTSTLIDVGEAKYRESMTVIT